MCMFYVSHFRYMPVYVYAWFFVGHVCTHIFCMLICASVSVLACIYVCICTSLWIRHICNDIPAQFGYEWRILFYSCSCHVSLYLEWVTHHDFGTINIPHGFALRGSCYHWILVFILVQMTSTVITQGWELMTGSLEDVLTRWMLLADKASSNMFQVSLVK